MKRFRLSHDARQHAQLPNAPFWNMLIDPEVSSRTFRKTFKEFHEFKSDAEKAAGRFLNRRDFIRYSGALATSFGLASTIGSIGFGGVRPAAAQGDKTLRIGYINTLDCELLAYIIDEMKILQGMGWNPKFLGAASGPQVMEAYIAGEIDFAYVGGPTPGLAAQRGIPLKLICGGMIGHGGWPVRNDLYDRGVTDLGKFFEYARK